ncbi:MAG: hypothetical protein ACUVQY_02040 [Thermoproteota archaeon]
MPSTPFETIILTLAFYGILFMSLAMFLMLYQWVMIDSVKIRLGEMANQVAYEITCIYSMCQQSRNDLSLFKPIEVPVSVSEKGYAMELKRVGNVWLIVAYLESNRAINASSPVLKDADLIVVETGYGTFQVGAYEVHYVGVLHSGQNKPAVWARRIDETITIGLGWVEEGG